MEPMVAQAMERQGGAVSRIDEIQARLNEALKVRPYEEQDRDEHKSMAWSESSPSGAHATDTNQHPRRTRQMSERIDHAAEAREWIDAAARHPGAVSTAILAQAEATLALVDQQRIANLIALAAMDPDGLGQSAYSALAAMSPDRRRTILAPDIAAALGIGDDDE